MGYSKRIAAWKAKGLCSSCGQRKPEPGGKSCERCRKYHRDYRAKLRAKGMCKCGRLPAAGGRNCEKCREHTKQYNRDLRDEVYAAYGGYSCKCCGETEPEFLQLDHVNNDGAEHRRAIGSRNVYYWCKKNGFPPGFQVLCANCNYAKAHYGQCPHRKEAKPCHPQHPHPSSSRSTLPTSGATGPRRPGAARYADTSKSKTAQCGKWQASAGNKSKVLSKPSRR